MIPNTSRAAEASPIKTASSILSSLETTTKTLEQDNNDAAAAATTTTTTTRVRRKLKPTTTNIFDVVEDVSEKDKVETETASISFERTKAETRIVGGEQAEIGDYPYFVDLKRFGCGASLIAPRVVLSAAHCDESGVNMLNEQVGIGAYKNNAIPSNAGTDLEAGLSVLVVDQVNHPDYDAVTEDNDLMLLLLALPVEIENPQLSISTSPDISDPPAGLDLTVMGLGALEEGEGGDDAPSPPTPDFLQHVIVPVIAPDICETQYRQGGNPNFNPDLMMCAGDTADGGIDSCQGDSGGPIVDASNGQKHIQYGVVSWGIGCARAQFPGVYAKTGSNIDWIREVTCVNGWNVEADYCEGPSTTESPTKAPVTEECADDEFLIDWRFTTDDFG